MGVKLMRLDLHARWVKQQNCRKHYLYLIGTCSIATTIREQSINTRHMCEIQLQLQSCCRQGVQEILRTQIVLLQSNSTKCFSTLDEFVKGLQGFKVDHYATVGDGHDSIVHSDENYLKHIDLGPWAKRVLADMPSTVL